MSIIDDAALNQISPYEAQAMLEKMNEIYKDGISVRRGHRASQNRETIKGQGGKRE